MVILALISDPTSAEDNILYRRLTVFFLLTIEKAYYCSETSFLRLYCYYGLVFHALVNAKTKQGTGCGTTQRTVISFCKEYESCCSADVWDGC